MEVNLKASPVLKWLAKTKKRINLLIGGRNSTKSWSTAIHILFNIFYGQSDSRIIVIRKTRPAVKKSCWALINDLISKYQLPVERNKTDLEIRRTDGSPNLISFVGLDDVEKLKSIENGNYIWVEEATEINLREYIDLDMIMRRHTTGINQMFLTCNPISELSWLKKELYDNPGKDVGLHKSNIFDNPFASKIDIQRIQRLKEADPNLWKIYGLGVFGQLENIIYHFNQVDIPVAFNEVIYGLDFGWNNQSSLTRGYITDKGIIWQELLYQRGLTNTKLIQKVKEIIPADHMHKYIFADSAEPDRIQEFWEAGFVNIQLSKKDVKAGIDYCKSHVIGITKDSINLIKESQSYKYKEDRFGNVDDQEPIKIDDHLLDAGRYMSFTYKQITSTAETLESSFR